MEATENADDEKKGDALWIAIAIANVMSVDRKGASIARTAAAATIPVVAAVTVIDDVVMTVRASVMTAERFVWVMSDDEGEGVTRWQWVRVKDGKSAAPVEERTSRAESRPKMEEQTSDSEGFRSSELVSVQMMVAMK